MLTRAVADAATVLVDADPEAAADGLAPLALGADVAERADLEDVGVVPSLAESGVGEDELEGLVEAEEALLVLHDERVGALGVVAGAGVGELPLLVERGLGVAALLVDGEVAVVDVLSGGVEVGALEERLVAGGLCSAGVLVLEDLGVEPLPGVAVLVVGAVEIDAGDEEETEHLDPLGPEAELLVEVLADGAADHLARDLVLVDGAVPLALPIGTGCRQGRGARPWRRRRHGSRRRGDSGRRSRPVSSSRS